MVILYRDLTVIANTILIGHTNHLAILSHLTKEMASLLLDQSFTYQSSLSRRFTIHGAETISRNSGVFEKASPIDGSLASLAEEGGYYQIFRRGPETVVKALSPPRSLKNLVGDEFLFAEETRLLGRLTLKDKIILAGHRTAEMTIESFERLARITQRNLGGTKSSLLMKDHRKIGLAIDKLCECVDELVKKVDLYPREVARVKVKLEEYPSIAGGMLASSLEDNQGSFDEDVKMAKTVRRGVHLLRSILRERNMYDRCSKSALIEERRFRNACKSWNAETPGTELTSNPLRLTDHLSSLLEAESEVDMF